MSFAEKWNLLLGEDRFRERSALSDSDKRNSFDRDYAKLIFSAPVRRLQGKTQVFPLPTDDYPRTRLTHSLEVSFLGGSIGASVESRLLDNGEISHEQLGLLPSLLRTAGLIHDLGNTPFGHFGESAIRDFFVDLFAKTDCGLSDIQKADFTYFDGNVQTFRMLTKLHYFGDFLSYNLSFQTLSSIIKYPSDSIEGNKGKKTKDIAKKKFGYFQSERKEYYEVCKPLGLVGKRNPVTFLLEAADDIAYRAADIEDSIKQKVISIDDMIGFLLSQGLSEVHKSFYDNMYHALMERNADLTSSRGFHDYVIAQMIRVQTQKMMINAVIDSFFANYDDIMNGVFHEELLSVSSVADINSAFKELFNQKVLVDRTINRLEIAGYQAIKGLLSMFVPACLKKGGGKGSFDNHIFKMISDEYRYINSKTEQSEYDMIQLAVDYVSGMTDDFAIDMYQRLSGIRI